MKTVPSLSVSRLNAGELNQTTSALTSILAPVRSDLFVDRQLQAIEEADQILAQVESTPRGSELTEEINRIDGSIDELLPMIESDLELSVAKAEFFPQQADAAEVLLNLFELRNRKDLIHGGYADQGHQIRRLLADLFAPENEAHRTASGAEPLLNRLKKEFEHLQDLLEARRNEDELPSTQRRQRRILRSRLQFLIPYVEANIMDGTEGFAEVHVPLSDLFTDVMSQYRARRTRRENADN
ncbi:MAG: hypothetical protein ACQEQ4_07465 [Fibrobacterota bacterium]